MFERKPLQKTLNPPVSVRELAPGHSFSAFERAAFGTVRLTLHSAQARTVVVHLGEKLDDGGTIDRDPPGCIRYRRIPLDLKPGTHTYTVAIPPDEINTRARAIPMPPEIGEVMPFRYCEVENCEGTLAPEDIRQVMVHYPFDDAAAAFESSDAVLNRVWELCKYTIKATSFCGLYVDGDRERIPYEADAYINQLCHYCADSEYGMARATLEHLVRQPTWPTEWLLHMPLMAWAEYEFTGNTDFLKSRYEDLRLRTLLDLAREDGLISTVEATIGQELLDSLHLAKPPRDLADWPPAQFTQGNFGERDGYEMVPVNTVVNAFHYRALVLMSRIAAQVSKAEDAAAFATRAARVRESFQQAFFDAERGIYVDGEGSRHASLHANLFPLALGLVPAGRVPRVAEFAKSRGMACSVYGAQYLLEGMYAAGEEEYALSLMTARHDRSWWHMAEIGSTMTLEAWDWKYKNNLDWNHAWGAAPGNVIPRFLMGVQPLAPGFAKVLVRPRPGNLKHARLRFPTVRGPIEVEMEQTDRFRLDAKVPEGVQVRLEPPPGRPADCRVTPRRDG